MLYEQHGHLQELLDATHHILGELEKEHKAQKAPGASADAAKPDADADELREKFRIVRVSQHVQYCRFEWYCANSRICTQISLSCLCQKQRI